ncbi:sugar transferase [Paenibacillus sp. GSMTC-2017]|uniref:sugar transferase n=1 Tax=Paenibacillus sp. GSMTC-2017 TaxID=2794350 RepID=UPI002FBECE96
MKRVFDFITASALLLVLSPFIAIIAILVRTKLGTPILFKQQRPGLHGKPFYVYKFRTMTDERGAEGELLSDFLRLTDFGKWLRKFSLDELPQLINIIKGDISLVGPRPLLMEYLPLYTDEQAKRHLVRPGLTGWAQVNGRNNVSWEDRFSYDVWYVEHHNLWIDLKIVMMTIKKVVHSEGISNGKHVTMPLFEGKATNKEG